MIVYLWKCDHCGAIKLKDEADHRRTVESYHVECPAWHGESPFLGGGIDTPHFRAFAQWAAEPAT
jgi:hypothetical protein